MRFGSKPPASNSARSVSRRLEAAALIEVIFKESVVRAGNPARNGVDGFRFAGVAFARARIEQLHRIAAEMREHVVGIDDILGMQTNRKRAWLRLGKLRRDRITERGPGGKAAVEHCDIVVADPAREKPKTRGKHIAAGIVGDELRRRRRHRTGAEIARSAPGRAAGDGRSCRSSFRQARLRPTRKRRRADAILRRAAALDRNRPARAGNRRRLDPRRRASRRAARAR